MAHKPSSPRNMDQVGKAGLQQYAHEQKELERLVGIFNAPQHKAKVQKLMDPIHMCARSPMETMKGIKEILGPSFLMQGGVQSRGVDKNHCEKPRFFMSFPFLEFTAQAWGGAMVQGFAWFTDWKSVSGIYSYYADGVEVYTGVGLELGFPFGFYPKATANTFNEDGWAHQVGVAMGLVGVDWYVGEGGKFNGFAITPAIAIDLNFLVEYQKLRWDNTLHKWTQTGPCKA